ILWQWQRAERNWDDALRQQRRAEQKEAEALREKAEADLQARQAREVVHNYYTRVSRSPRLKNAGLHEFRKELLAEAGRYYRRFVEQRPKDPALQDELARSYYRLAQITADTESDAKGIEVY